MVPRIVKMAPEIDSDISRYRCRVPVLLFGICCAVNRRHQLPITSCIESMRFPPYYRAVDAGFGVFRIRSGKR